MLIHVIGISKTIANDAVINILNLQVICVGRYPIPPNNNHQINLEKKLPDLKDTEYP